MADQLRSVLGIRDVVYTQGQELLAVTDESLRRAEPTPCRRPMIIVIASAARFQNNAPIRGERVCIRRG
jgi:hypothetical protein